MESQWNQNYWIGQNRFNVNNIEWKSSDEWVPLKSLLLVKWNPNDINGIECKFKVLLMYGIPIKSMFQMGHQLIQCFIE